MNKRQTGMLTAALDPLDLSMQANLSPKSGDYFEWYLINLYKGESVNSSQMYMKRKTCHIRTWGKQLFLDISSTNIDTLVPSLNHYVETRSTQVSGMLSQPLPHLRLNLFVISETFATKLVF
jgi:hypothetical protein